MATITKRGDLQWQAKIRVKGYPSQSRTFIYRDDAEKWAKETEVAIERGLFFDRTKAERNTVSELIARYRTDVMPGLSGKHISPALNALEPVFGAYALSSVTSEMICTHRDKRLKTVEASTVKKEINLLSKIIDLAGDDWGIKVAVNPCLTVKRPKEPNGRERRFVGTEEKYLLFKCEDSSKALETIAIVAIETAARLGELLNLKWSQVKFAENGKGTALLLKTKNGEKRTIPLSSRAVAALKSLRESENKDNSNVSHISGRIFHNWTASDSFNKTWSRVCERTGIEDLKFHDLRHEACSRLADKFEMHELMKITGHKTAAMFARYYHPRAEDLARKLG